MKGFCRKFGVEAAAEIVAVCQALVGSTRDVQEGIGAFSAYFVNGEGRRPGRERWPDRLLNPKLNGTCELLKRLRLALGCFLPGTLPSECVTALAEMTDAATRFVASLEGFKRIESLERSMTAELDLFTYMTVRRCGPLTWSHHRANLKEKIKAMKASFYDNSAAYYAITSEILCLSPYGKTEGDAMDYDAVIARLKAMRGTEEPVRPVRVVAVSEEAAARLAARAPDAGKGRPRAVTLQQAETLLASACRSADLGDRAVTARTLRRWESGETAALAGYTADCRDSVLAFETWVRGYIVHCRAEVRGERVFIRFDENLHGR